MAGAPLGVERLGVGDSVAIVGQLAIRTEKDREGRKRISFNVRAKQVLFLRLRSVQAAIREKETERAS
jgi:hypothetical protein